MKRNIIWPLFLLLALGCNRTGSDAKGSFTADAAMNGGFPGSPRLTGKLYLSDGHLRIDWGPFADVFDLRQRKGWPITPEAHTYEDLLIRVVTAYISVPRSSKPSKDAARTIIFQAMISKT